jgi:hypothetical protein
MGDIVNTIMGHHRKIVADNSPDASAYGANPRRENAFVAAAI